MKRNIQWCLLLVLSLFIWACGDVVDDLGESEEEQEILPGEEYEAHGKYNLNVVYYVLAEQEELELWHKRLSGTTLHMQEFFRQGLKLYGYDKKFGLEINKVNPEYINIHYIKSERKVADLKTDKFQRITDDVMAYFKKNSGELKSNHFLIYMPQIDGTPYFADGYRSSELAGELPDYAFAIAGCDAVNFNMRHFTSKRAREKYLVNLGQAMHTLGHAFYLAHSKEKAEDTFYSVMGKSGDAYNGGFINYAKYPDMIKLTYADAMWLNQVQVFNQEHSLGKTMLEVTFEKKDIYYHNDTVYAECVIRSTEEVAGVIMYSDPWKTADKNYMLDIEYDRNPLTWTDDDALAVCVEQFTKEGDLYKFTAAFPWRDVTGMDYAPVGRETIGKAEIRFRVIMQGGLAAPFPALSVKGGPEFRWEFDVERRLGSDRRNVYIPLIADRD